MAAGPLRQLVTQTIRRRFFATGGPPPIAGGRSSYRSVSAELFAHLEEAGRLSRQSIRRELGLHLLLGPMVYATVLTLIYGAYSPPKHHS